MWNASEEVPPDSHAALGTQVKVKSRTKDDEVWVWPQLPVELALHRRQYELYNEGKYPTLYKWADWWEGLSVTDRVHYRRCFVLSRNWESYSEEAPASQLLLVGEDLEIAFNHFGYCTELDSTYDIRGILNGIVLRVSQL